MNNDIRNASFAYSVNLLRLLLGMKLITKEEYEKIVAICAEHYGTEKIYVWNDKYAYADTEMKRKAIEMATSPDSPLRAYTDSERYTISDDEMIKKLYGIT